MKKSEVLNQLSELMNDRQSLIGSDLEANKIYEKDIEALNFAWAIVNSTNFETIESGD